MRVVYPCRSSRFALPHYTLSYRVHVTFHQEVLHWSPDLEAMTNNRDSPHVRSVSRNETRNVPTGTGPPGNNQESSPGRDVLMQLGIDDITRSMLAHRDEVATQGAVRRIYLDLLSRIGMDCEPSRLTELRLGSSLDDCRAESLTKRYSRTERKVASLSERLEETYGTILAQNSSLTQRVLVLEKEIRGLRSEMVTQRLPVLDNVNRRNNVTEPSVLIESVREPGVAQHDHPAPLQIPAARADEAQTRSAHAPNVTRLPTSAPSEINVPGLPLQEFTNDDTCPGLVPHETMLNQFTNVVSYTNYRLKNRRVIPTTRETELLARTKKSFDGLYPRLETFNGKKPITLLSFLSTIREGFDHLFVSEAVGVSLLSFYLEGSAKSVYVAQTQSGARSTNVLNKTWPYVVHALIKRFLTDDVLQEAYENVTTVTQKSNEDENAFADRLGDLVRNCAGVFTDREIVQYYARGLSPLIRERVLYALRNMRDYERDDLTAVRRLASAEGSSVRSLRTVPSTSTRVRTHAPVRPVLSVSGDPLPPFEPAEEDPDLRYDPMYSLNMVEALDNVTSPVGGSVLAIRQDNDRESTKLVDRVNRRVSDVPALTDEQIQQAYFVIPEDYWSLNCWSCRECGHSTFTCPYLYPNQRLFFAYQYYCYQVEQNPSMKNFLQDRARKRSQYGQPRTRGNLPQGNRQPYSGNERQPSRILPSTNPRSNNRLQQSNVQGGNVRNGHTVQFVNEPYDAALTGNESGDSSVSSDQGNGRG